MFAAFALLLPALPPPRNLHVLQNVAILGILGLGMALVVIGRGIDISLDRSARRAPGARAADGAGWTWAAVL